MSQIVRGLGVVDSVQESRSTRWESETLRRRVLKIKRWQRDDCLKQPRRLCSYFTCCFWVIV